MLVHIIGTSTVVLVFMQEITMVGDGKITHFYALKMMSV